MFQIRHDCLTLLYNKANEFVDIKRNMGAQYNYLLNDLKNIQLPKVSTDYAENIYWVYGIVLDDCIPFDANEVMKRLNSKGIGTRPFFWPMHQQPIFHKMGLFKGESYPVSERIARMGFYLPSGMALSQNQITYTAEMLKQVINDK